MQGRPRRPWRRARLLAGGALAAAALTAAACGGGAAPDAAPTPPPDLRLEIQTDEIGPNRTNVFVVATNVGVTDVLLQTSLVLPANAGSDRDSGPTTRAEVTNASGREVGANAREAKTLTWAPERLRAGVTLRWEAALRCFDRAPSSVAAAITSVEVGSVREAHFEDMQAERSVTCPPPRDPRR